MKKVIALVLSLSVLAACKTEPSTDTATNSPSPATNTETTDSAAPMTETASADIVDTAVAAGSFTTLAKALAAANLVDTLKGEGPFTVFAPTDAAFAALPAGTLDKLLANPTELAKVLTYHVVPGNVSAADVVKLTTAKTVEGSDIKITVTDGKVKVDGANVTQTDIKASNGTIHVIDAVILPGN